MAIYRDKWFECWFSDGSDVLPTYLLLVTPDPEKAGNILVVDPLKNNEIVYRERDYEDACSWLSEDEFEQLEGRVYPDDGLGPLG